MKPGSHNYCYLCGYSNNGEAVSYFKFPAIPELQSAWAEFCNIQLPIHPKTRLCSNHFHGDVLLRTSNDQFRLRKNAVPTIQCDTEEESEKKNKNNKYYRCILCGKEDNVSYFRFPKREDLRISWSTFCEIDSNKIHSKSRLCEKHFVNSDFLNGAGFKSFRPILKSDAIPTIRVQPKLQRSNNKKQQCSFCRCKNEDLSFFSFPKNENVRILWAMFCGLKQENIPPNYKLCSHHFDTDCIQFDNRTVGGIMKLKPSAIPSILCNKIFTDVKKTKTGTGTCFICGVVDKEHTSFFQFPKEESIRRCWAKFCKTSVRLIFSHHRLCSEHFTESDILFDNRNLGGMIRLKKGVVPTKNISNFNVHDPQNINEVANNIDLSYMNDFPEPWISIETDSSANLSDLNADYHNNTKVTQLLITAKDVSGSTGISYSQHSTSVEQSKMEIAKAQSYSFSEVSKKRIQRRFSQPRYLGDFTSRDFNSPKWGKIYFRLSKEYIKKKNCALKKQREQNRKLLQKITHFNTVLEQMKSNQLISENAAEILTVGTERITSTDCID